MRERGRGRYRGRVLLLAIMVGGAMLAQSLFSRRSVQESQADDGLLVSGRSQEQYEGQLPFWNSLPVVAVRDLARLTEGVSLLVESTPASKSGRLVEAEPLARDMARFLWARCSSESGDEYLSRAAAIRQLRTDNIADDLEIQHWHRALIGRVSPSQTDPAALLTAFWERAKLPANRIAAVSTEGNVRMARTKPADLNDARNLSQNEIINAVWPDWSDATEGLERWSMPYDRGFPRLTEPEGDSLREVIREFGTTYFCIVRLVGESEDGGRVPLGMLLYLSPEEHRWHVLWFTNQHIGGLGRPY